MVIDDLANRNHICDLLLDQNFKDSKRYKGLIPDNSELLLGPKYALLSEDYLTAREEINCTKSPIKRLFIFFGNIDEYNLTNKTVEAIMDINIEFTNIDIVLSKDSPQFLELSSRCKNINEINIHSDLPSLSTLIKDADLSIGAGGSSTWERMCLGLPSAVITIANNQIPLSKKLNDEGLIFLIGSHLDVSKKDISNVILSIMNESDISKLSKRCMNTCLGNGLEKVRDKILKMSDKI